MLMILGTEMSQIKNLYDMPSISSTLTYPNLKAKGTFQQLNNLVKIVWILFVLIEIGKYIVIHDCVKQYKSSHMNSGFPWFGDAIFMIKSAAKSLQFQSFDCTD